MKTFRNLVLTGIAAAFIGLSGGQAQQVEAGKTIFEANCKSCHDIKTDVVGPALKDVEKRRGADWVKSFIKNSQKMVQSGDKDAVALFEKFNKIPMPSFESSLKDEDLDAVLAYIKAESEAPVVAEKPVVTTPETPEKPVVNPGFSLSDVPGPLLIGGAIFTFLMLLVIVMMCITFVSALPLLGKFYARPENSNSVMAKLVGLMRGDATTLTGKHDGAIIEDHSYDGIHELDNDLPPWWKYSFYATIVFSVVYLLHYHVLDTGKLQTAEYEIEMQQAALLSANDITDPNAVTDFKVITDATAIENGKNLYIQNCAACHGKEGEGTVGPNLTDEFWLHGGDVNDIFKTIKFGVTSKGMVAWDKKLNKDQILEVSSYILSLQGTKPANGKAPQGEKFEAKK